MKCHLSVDEKWPVYSLEKIDICATDEEFDIDVDNEMYIEYVWLMAKYDIIQQKLKEYHEKQRSKSAANIREGNFLKYPSALPIPNPS